MAQLQQIMLGFNGSGAGGDLSSVISSTCADLDATIAASYGGSGQTWSNMVLAPADGAAQTDYDFYRGTTSAVQSFDPVFNGSAGSQAAYWSFDGTQLFVIKSGVNPAFIKGMHKTSVGKGWFAMAAKTPGSFGSDTLMGTTDATGPSHGMMIAFPSSTASRINRYAGAGQNSGPNCSDSVTSTDTLMIYSWDFTSGNSNNVRHWNNNRTKETLSFTLSADTTDCSNHFTLCALGDGGNPLSTGWQLRTAAVGNAFIDDSDAVKIFNLLNTRHGITYA